MLFTLSGLLSRSYSLPHSLKFTGSQSMLVSLFEAPPMNNQRRSKATVTQACCANKKAGAPDIHFGFSEKMWKISQLHTLQRRISNLEL
jgi:hypothetical protein